MEIKYFNIPILEEIIRSDQILKTYHYIIYLTK